MRTLKKILLALLIAFIVIQFIQPARNNNGQASSADLIKSYKVPENLREVLITSCYDCHSNNTNYPWYVNIQPVGWLLANHIKNGKAELNFNEFSKYPRRRQLSKLKAIGNSVKDGSMPLASYTFMHHDAKLSKGNKALIIDWATRTRDSIERQN